MDSLLSFLIFWGVWLLVPILIDGCSTAASLVAVLAAGARRQNHTASRFTPFVSIIIPVYNSAATLEACLRSLAEQDYPPEQMEVLLINNGSRDNSFGIFNELQPYLPLNVSWHSIINQGKAWALNAGIHLCQGSYIFNVDSDVVLARDAVRQVVDAMEAQPDLAAVTGAVHVLPPEPNASRLQAVLAECEFFEYLTAFHVGRVHQTLLRNLYTLSGAFSVFRREVLLSTFLYSHQTVTEDTDLTFELYERFRSMRIGCVSRAVAYVHPVESLAALYAQRVRWQRGQVEVSARHAGLMQEPIWSLRRFSPARILAVDHTLAFPRLVWTFLLPILVTFGYPAALIVQALLALYVFYLLLDLAWIGTAWLGVGRTERKRLRRLLPFVPVLPLYRNLIFWFRMAGFLQAVAEPQSWRVEDPWAQTRRGWSDLQVKARRLAARLKRQPDDPPVDRGV